MGAVVRDVPASSSFCCHAYLGLGGKIVLKNHCLQSDVTSTLQSFSNLKLTGCTQFPAKSKRHVRCLYSPLVKTFECSRVTPSRVGEEDGKDVNGSTSMNLLSSPGDFSSQRQFLLYHEQVSVLGHDDFEQATHTSRSSGEVHPDPQDPVAASLGDQSLIVRISEVGHDVDSRRSARLRPPSASLSQGFVSSGGQAVSCTIGAAGRPVARSSKLKGPAGFIMALAVAILGIATAVQKTSSSQPQKICTKCEGYGMVLCNICGGIGRIQWEGKLSRTDPCPRCFGSCLNKCASCEGMRMMKGKPPCLEKPKVVPRRKR